MRTIWHSLAWKEWHEHKWKLVSLVAILWGIVLLPLLDPERGTLIGLHAGLMLGIAPLAMFIGLGTAAGERSRGTLRFLQALPVPMWRVALHKIGFGLITFLVPALSTIALVVVWFKCLDLLGIKYQAAADLASFASTSRNPLAMLTASWPANAALTLTLVGVSFYIWTIAAGVNRKDEVSAGAVALAAIAGWWLLLSFSWSQLSPYFEPSIAARQNQMYPQYAWLVVAGLATAPGGMIAVAVEQTVGQAGHLRLLLFALVVAMVFHLSLATWYVRRFARISDLEIRSPMTAGRTAGMDWLGKPRRSPFTAIVWKQFRESLPLLLMGLVIVSGTAALMWSVNLNQSVQFGEVYVGVAASMGLAIAMIVGIGVFLPDVGPGINSFWRSRPIQTDLWFWTKFLCGLALLLTAIYGPILLIAWSDRWWFSSPDEALIFPAMHIAIFAAAVAMTCLVRHAVYAAILSVAMAYLGFAAVGLALVIGRLVGWVEIRQEFMLDLTTTQVIIGLTLSIVTSVVLAWLAVRYDWGQKSRY